MKQAQARLPEEAPRTNALRNISVTDYCRILIILCCDSAVTDNNNNGGAASASDLHALHRRDIAVVEEPSACMNQVECIPISVAKLFPSFVPFL